MSTWIHDNDFEEKLIPLEYWVSVLLGINYSIMGEARVNNSYWHSQQNKYE